MLGDQVGKFCQSCIERGFNPPNPATREFNPNEFLCEDCFQAVLQNLQSIAPDSLSQRDVKQAIDYNAGPILETVYNLLNVPLDLRFDTVDTTCRNYDKIFNFHAPSVLNYGSMEELANEIEQRAMALFQIKYSIEPLELKIKQLKDKAREERKLKGLSDSKEEYAKSGKTSKVKATQEEKMVRALGMSVENYRQMVRKAKEQEFNKLVGNAPDASLTEEDKTLAGIQEKTIIPGSAEAKKVSSEVVIKRRF